MVNRLAMVLDFNNLSFRALHTCKYQNPEVKSFRTEHEKTVLATKLIRDISSIVKQFSPTMVYLAIDEKNPWRSDICENYKGTRPHDDTIDMSSVFLVMNDVVEILKNNGYDPIKVRYTEADDIAALIKEKCIGGDTSVVYVSSDADWLQLADYNKDTNQFFAIYNPIKNNHGIKKFNATQDMIDWLNAPTSMFDRNISPVKTHMKSVILADVKIEMYPINPDAVLMNKIMCGDDGDNVPTFYDFMNDNGVKVRVTPKRMEKILESCGNPSNVTELSARVSDGSLQRALCDVLKHKEESLNFSLRLNRQRLYVELNPSLFPKEIRDMFDKEYTKITDNKTSYAINTDPNAMVRGTKYEKISVGTRDARLDGIFKHLIDKPVIHVTV